MKSNYINALCFLGAAYFLTGCSVRVPSVKTPKSSFYMTLDNVKLNDGYPAKKEPWVVISDRNNNTVFMDKGEEKSPKEIKFLEPLLVLKHKPQQNLVKVAEYHPDALLKKLPSNSVKTYGWIPADQLLLWRHALKNNKNGFNMKATLVPSHSDVLKNSEKYIKNDSVLVFTSPDLSKTSNKKIPVGQIIYVYKQAENNNRYLIGKSPTFKIDSIQQNIYGWVSSKMVSLWGDRTALKVSPDYQYSEENNLSLSKTKTSQGSTDSYFKLSDSNDRTIIENIIATTPVEIAKENKARFFTNALDYSKNFVYNVLGEPIYFDRYKEIMKNNRKLNIVFVMDISNENSQNTAMAKSSFQDLQIKLKNIEYYKDVNFGTVLYKNNPCGDNVAVSKLSHDFSEISKFMEQHIAQDNCNSYGGQPMQEGLTAAGDLLAPFHDETNVVVLIGSTAANGGYISNAISSLTSARAKIIAYQTVAGSSDFYNNFVLLSESLVTNTAKNIGEIEKQRVMDQKVVKSRNNYSLKESEEGFFYLDYPETSMSQGFVIFPKKGDINSNAFLAKSLDSLISQVTQQNMDNDKALTNYFKSDIGASRTTLRPDFVTEFPDVPALIPVTTASQLVTYNYPFITGGTYTDDFKEYTPAVRKGVLLSEEEYDKLRNIYEQIYTVTKSKSPNFSQRKAVEAYLDVLKRNDISAEGISKSDLRKKTMAYSVAFTTGFDNAGDELLSKFELRGWKKGKIVPKDAVKTYFSQYRTLADRLLDNKNSPKVMVKQNGEVYYWLNDYFMPKMTLSENL